MEAQCGRIARTGLALAVEAAEELPKRGLNVPHTRVLDAVPPKHMYTSMHNTACWSGTITVTARSPLAAPAAWTPSTRRRAG